jgi:hypothetical protein
VFVESDVWDELEKHCKRGKPFYPEVVAGLVDVAIKRGRKLESELFYKHQVPNAWGYDNVSQKDKSGPSAT